MKLNVIATAVLCFATGLSGCASAPAERPAVSTTVKGGTTVAGGSSSPSGRKGEAMPAAADRPAAAAAPRSRSEPTIIRGDDRFFKSPEPASPVLVSGDAVSLHFEQAPVTDVVHALLGDMLKVPYTITQGLSGEVTLHTHAPVQRVQIVPLLEAVLQANGLAMVRDPDGMFFVGKPDTLRGLAPSVRSNNAPLPPGLNTVIVPLKFVGAAEMADILKPIASPSAFLRVDASRNLLILAGSRNQVAGWLDIVDTFDIDALRGMSIGFFPLQHVSARDVEVALKAMFTGTQGAGSAPAEATRSAGAQDKESPAGVSAASAVPTQISVGPLSGVVRVLPLERLGGILVVTSRSHYLDTAREWIEKFDQPGRGGGESQLFVYPVQNGTAAHLASLLSGVFGGGGAGASQSQDSGVAPGLRTGSMSLGGSLGGGLAGGQRGSTGGLGAVGATGSRTSAASSVTQYEFPGKVRVVADQVNNSLLIYATGVEYGSIERALKQLDRAPAQILIEASIVEVTLTDELQYGLQWHFDGLLGHSGYLGSGTLNPNASGGISATQPGFSYSVTNPAGAIRAVLNLLAEKSLLNVISTPSVMVLDNHTAQIQVGGQQPVRSAQTVTDGGTTTSSIQYKDTGVMLTVTPSVNAGNMVSMDISQAVTDVGDIDLATGQVSFLQRQFASRVAVRTGETVVLGGLIKDNKTNSKQGLPVLQDLPLVGSLFSTTGIRTNRTELMVMLTPRVLRTDQDLREVGAELRDRLTGVRLTPSGAVQPGPGAASLSGPQEPARNESVAP